MIEPDVEITDKELTFTTMVGRSPQRLTFQRAAIDAVVGREVGPVALRMSTIIHATQIGEALAASIKANKTFAVVDLKRFYTVPD